MNSRTFPWSTGGGQVTVLYSGEGSGALSITSSSNTLSVPREMSIKLKTIDSSVYVTLHIVQYGHHSLDFSIDFNSDFSTQ